MSYEEGGRPVGEEAMAGQGPREHYRRGEAEAGVEAVTLESRVLRISWLRTFAFFVMVGPFLLLETTARELWPLLVGSGVIGIGIFLTLIRLHGRLRRRVARARLRETLNREAQARLSRDWDALPPPPLTEAPADRPSAEDLDLVGRASLSHLLGRVVTAPGKAVLRQIVLDPFSQLPATGSDLLERIRSEPGAPTAVPDPSWAERLDERQGAVRCLSGEAVFREQLELLGREIERGGSPDDAARFLEWLERPRWLADRKGLLIAGRVLGVLTPLSLVTWLSGWTPGLLPLLGALALCAVALHRTVAPHAAERLGTAEAGEGDLVGWSAIFALSEAEGPNGCVLLEGLRESFQAPRPGATRAIRKLVRIIDTASVRWSSLAHFPLVALLA